MRIDHPLEMTLNHPYVQIRIEDPSQAGEARRACAKIAENHEWDEEQAGRVSIIVAELASNILKHATAGEILLHGNGRSMTVYAMDRGKGIADLQRSMADGYSTAGSSGTGLGAVRRLSDQFDVFTQSSGTVVWSVVGERVPENLQTISLCHPHETECGDAWHGAATEERDLFAVVDGLGHGPLAALAARGAVQTFAENPQADPTDLLRMANSRLSGSRGAAAACALFDTQSGELCYAGIGNITGSLVTEGARKGLVSCNGTLGVAFSRCIPFAHSVEDGTLLVMHSDGIRDRWSLSDYPGLLHRNPALIAAVLFRDFARNNDDATILVCRLSKRGEAR